MPPVLNRIGIHVACVGNHDFDHGVPRMKELIDECQFPWLLGNVYDRKTRKPILNLHRHGIIRWQGYTIGVLSLVEREWLSTISSISVDDVRL